MTRYRYVTDVVESNETFEIPEDAEHVDVEKVGGPSGRIIVSYIEPTESDSTGQDEDFSISDDSMICIWKVPEEPIEEPGYEDVGISVAGELMGLCENYDLAMQLIEILEEVSPSERYGDSMDDAPYLFTTSVRLVYGD